MRRRPDARDPRIERLFVTRAAVAQLEVARALSDEVRNEAMQGLTAFECVQLTQLLQKVRRNLANVVPTPLDTVVPAALRRDGPRDVPHHEATASNAAVSPGAQRLDGPEDGLSECTDLRPR